MELNRAVKVGNEYHLDIRFDVTKEGIVFGTQRRYKPNFIATLVNSTATKQAVEGGYSLIMYGHGARDPRANMWAMEVHPVTKQLQFPLGRVSHVSINGKIINLKMILTIAKDNHAETIVELMKSGVGGFSTHFSVKDKMLQGCDYVLARNFERNKIHEFISDSFVNMTDCKDGICKIIDNTVENVAVELSNGGSNQVVSNIYSLLVDDPMLNMFKKLEDKIKEKELEVNNLKLDLVESEQTLLNTKEKLKDKNKKIKKSVKAIKKALEDSHLLYDEEENRITGDKDSFSHIFKESIKYQEVDMNLLKSVGVRAERVGIKR